MKRNGQCPLWVDLLSMAAMLTLSACGGGAAETVTVAKVLDQAPATVAADGTLVMSVFPAPGASQAAVDGLARAGVLSVSRKCGQLRFAVAADGSELLTLGGTPTFVVLVDVDSNDLDKAKQAGYVAATDDFMKSIREVFDCSSRSM